jgi:HrpA-like RNA helicase
MDQLGVFLQNVGQKVCILKAPTGYGKTTGAFLKFIETSSASKNTKYHILMPFRVSVQPMFDFVRKLQREYLSETVNTIQIRWSIGGGTNNGVQNPDVHIHTVGHFIEEFINTIIQNFASDEPVVFMLDEVHDRTKDTEFALNLLLHYISKHENAKLILSSATLDIREIIHLYGIEDPIIISTPEALANVEVRFMDKSCTYYNAVTREFDQEKMFKEIVKQLSGLVAEIFSKPAKKEGATMEVTSLLKKLKKPTTEPAVALHPAPTFGHILILMPGQEEIRKLAEIIAGNQQFTTFEVLPLYSQMSQEDIEYAINCETQPKIIISTNIVENAITINNLLATIDCGVRKVMYMNDEGINELRIEAATKSNIIQCYGRSGRQGMRGIGLVMMTQTNFEDLPFSASLESERNPVYSQLVRIYKHKLPVTEILPHVSRAKIASNTLFLLENGVIEESESEYTVTQLGEKIMNFSTSISVGRFVVTVVTEMLKHALPLSYYYYLALVAAWIENKPNPFFQIRLRPGASQEERAKFEEDSDTCYERHSEFVKNDCLETFLCIWNQFCESKNQNHWCIENFIFKKTLDEVNKTKNDILYGIVRSFKITIPSCDFLMCKNNTITFEERETVIISFMKSYIRDLFCKNRFTFVKRDCYGAKYSRDSEKSTRVYMLDKFVRCHAVSSENFETICCFGLRSRGNIVFLSGILNFEMSD